MPPEIITIRGRRYVVVRRELIETVNSKGKPYRYMACIVRPA